MSRTRCELNGKYGKCEGRVQRHHMMKRQHIRQWIKWLEWMSPQQRKRKGMPDPDTLPSVTQIIDDDRGTMSLCKRHHELVEKRTVPAAAIPDSARALADELGMGWYWGRHYYTL